MLEKLYKLLWSHVGGQPWTLIIRDSYRKYPLLWLFGGSLFGVILGHLFW